MARGALIALTLTLAAAQQPDFEHLYREALEQRERTLGKDSPKTRESERDLALYLATRGDYARATPHLQAAIELADTPAGATALHNWAVTLEDNNPAVAEKMYRKALAIRAKVLPVSDVETASTRLNLASLLVADKTAEAAQLASTALAVFETKLGPTHERAGAACGVLGAARAVEGNVPAAERLFRRALAIAEKAHGPDSHHTADALENLADLLTQTGRQSAASPLLDRAKNIRLRTR